MSRTLCNIFIIITLTSCSTTTTQSFNLDSDAIEREARIQKEIAFKQQLKYNKKLFDVGYPILKSNADLCGEDVHFRMAAGWASIEQYDREWREAASLILGLDEKLRFVTVSEKGPAGMAGIKNRDIIVSINDIDPGETKREHDKFNKEFTKLQKNNETIKVVVQRGDELINFDLNMDRVCNYPISLGENDFVNAYADGNNIVIEKGMMRFVEDDIELGLVIAHELGHNAMKHMDKRMTNYAVGSIFDIAAAAYGVNTGGLFGESGAMIFSKEFEDEADYVGLYYMHRAGMDISNAGNFWRRMAAEHPGAIRSNHAATHPATPERFLKIDITVDEINEKVKYGEPVIPSFE